MMMRLLAKQFAGFALAVALFIPNSSSAKCDQERSEAPRRILAMAPHIVEILYEIGAQDEIVGVARYSNFPPDALRLPQIGGHDSIDVEAALRAEPTAAIVLERTISGVASLERLGVEIYASRPETVRESLAEIERIAEIVCRREEGRRIRRDREKRLEAIKRKRPATPLRVFYEIWHDPLTTIGASSFIHDALGEAGATNVFGDEIAPSFRIGAESVLRANPDVIVIAGSAEHITARSSYWRRWFPKGTVRIVSLEDDLVQRPGPRIVDGVEAIQKVLFDEENRP